jgi:hypothetical protein
LDAHAANSIVIQGIVCATHKYAQEHLKGVHALTAKRIKTVLAQGRIECVSLNSVSTAMRRHAAC